MSPSGRNQTRKSGYLLALFALLFFTDFFLGSTPFAAIGDAAVLAIFVLFLSRGLLVRSVSLDALEGQAVSNHEPPIGPIAGATTLVKMAMGGDYASRARIARTMAEALESSSRESYGGEVREKGRLELIERDRRLGDLLEVLKPARPDPTTDRVKATKASRERYLRNLEGALGLATRGGS